MATVLITDAQERAMLAASRSLHRAGWAVHAAASQRPAPGQWSRSCDRRFRVCDPKGSPVRFVEDLVEILDGHGEGVLLPGSDASLLAISNHRERLEGRSRVGLPDREAVARSLSKVALNEAAEGLGFAVPETLVCADDASALAAASRLGYPLALKPDRSVFELGGLLHQQKSAVVHDQSSLLRLLPRFGDRMLVQRHEPGALLSFAGVIVEDRLIASVFSRYRRMWPPDGGSVSYSETLTPSAHLGQRVRELLVMIGWQGMFELEMIQRPDGDPAPIDLNPRAYGSLALAARAGVPLAVVWCEWLHGNELRMGAARPGVRYRWEDADARHLLWQLRRDRPARALAVLAMRRRTVQAHFEPTDPLPFFARLALMARHRTEPSKAALSRRLAAPWRRPGLTAAARGEPSSETPVAVIGAGPYGLAATAFLEHAGVPVRLFGRPMEFWRNQMPHGMLLRSRWRSSHIADPGRGLTLDVFEQERGSRLGAPIPVEDFIEYGEWYQRRVADPDRRRIEVVEPVDGGFSLRLEDGETMAASRVVVATGLRHFECRPEPLASLPGGLVSHSSDHVDFTPFAGRSVLVVGGGQSALESAALLSEAGAEVEVLARRATIKWLHPDDDPSLGARVNHLILPPTDVGGRVTGWVAAAPDLYRRVPEHLRPTVMRRVAGPAGADWLRPRLEDVRITLERTVVSAENADGVRVELADGSGRSVDHVILATGFKVDVASAPFLSAPLLGALERENGSPVLGPGLESSVPGLHFLGASAAHSFGPIMRFVVGTWYAAPALAERIIGKPRRPLRLSYRPRHPLSRAGTRARTSRTAQPVVAEPPSDPSAADETADVTTVTR